MRSGDTREEQNMEIDAVARRKFFLKDIWVYIVNIKRVDQQRDIRQSWEPKAMRLLE